MSLNFSNQNLLIIVVLISIVIMFLTSDYICKNNTEQFKSMSPAAAAAAATAVAAAAKPDAAKVKAAAAAKVEAAKVEAVKVKAAADAAAAAAKLKADAKTKLDSAQVDLTKIKLDKTAQFNEITKITSDINIKLDVLPTNLPEVMNSRMKLIPLLDNFIRTGENIMRATTTFNNAKAEYDKIL
jgi:hypothetical protein